MNLLQRLLFNFRNKIRVDENNSVEISKSAKVANCYISIKGKNNRVYVGNDTKIRDSKIEISGNNCEIIILDNCVIGHDSYLVCKDENINIEVGSHCMISRNVKIMASDGHVIFDNNHTRVNKSKSIRIKDNVWLADNVTILKGITIGDKSVVGINATLSKSIPSSSIAVGNPAKVVKESIYWKK